MMGICGPYISSVLLMLSMVIGQYMVLFFSAAYFGVFVDGHPTSCWGILSSFTTLISHWWKYSLLLSIFFIKVQSASWMLIMLCSMLVV